MRATIFGLFRCGPRVRTRLVIRTTKYLRPGTLKQSWKQTSSIFNRHGRFLLAMAFLPSKIFQNRDIAGTPKPFERIFQVS